MVATTAALALLCSPTFAQASGLPVGKPVDQSWVLVSAVLVFLMQAGFLCLEVGCVRPAAATITALKNVVDWVVCALTFFMLGWGLMFSPSASGLIGSDLGLLAANFERPDALALQVHFLFQLVFAGTAATIVSGALAERTGFAAYVVVSAAVTAVIYPILGHWVWGNSFFSTNHTLLSSIGFVDFAGSTVVHSVGGWVSLVGVFFVGPRLGRFSEAGEPRPMAQTGAQWTALGVLLLWVAWWGFNGGSAGALDARVGPIILNTNLAGAMGGLTAIAHCWIFQGRVDVSGKFLNGILAGLVGITASCHATSPLAAMLIGASSGLVANLVAQLLLRLRLDDPVGAIPVHLGAGVWGTLCVGLFGRVEKFPNAHTRLEQIGVQLIGIGTCAGWCVFASALLFLALRRWVGLRVSPQAEIDGYDIAGVIQTRPQDEGLTEAELRRLLGQKQ